MISNKLLDINYYLDRLSLYFKKSYGIKEQVNIFVELLKQMDLVEDQLFERFDIFKEVYEPTSEFLDFLANIFNVHRRLNVNGEYIVLNDIELLTYIKFQVFKNNYEGLFKQMKETYDALGFNIEYEYQYNAYTAGDSNFNMYPTLSITKGKLLKRPQILRLEGRKKLHIELYYTIGSDNYGDQIEEVEGELTLNGKAISKEISYKNSNEVYKYEFDISKGEEILLSSTNNNLVLYGLIGKDSEGTSSGYDINSSYFTISTYIVTSPDTQYIYNYYREGVWGKLNLTYLYDSTASIYPTNPATQYEGYLYDKCLILNDKELKYKFCWTSQYVNNVLCEILYTIVGDDYNPDVVSEIEADILIDNVAYQGQDAYLEESNVQKFKIFSFDEYEQVKKSNKIYSVKVISTDTSFTRQELPLSSTSGRLVIFGARISFGTSGSWSDESKLYFRSDLNTSKYPLYKKYYSPETCFSKTNSVHSSAVCFCLHNPEAIAYSNNVPSSQTLTVPGRRDWFYDTSTKKNQNAVTLKLMNPSSVAPNIKKLFKAGKLNLKSAGIYYINTIDGE